MTPTPLQKRLMANLPNAKTIYFPNTYINHQNTGNHYFEISNIQVQQNPDWCLWATAQKGSEELIITCDHPDRVTQMVEYFEQSNQAKTVCHYNLHDVDEAHTDIMRLIQYGEYRSLSNKVAKNAIYYAMVYGINQEIPF